MKKKNIVAFILARKGSKRLKNKNLQILFNKTSLVEATIKFAKKLRFVNDIILSSDHEKIHNIGKKEKILSPGLRPKNLSSGNTSSEKVIEYLLNWYEQNKKKIDGILLLQPTTPYRDISLFNKAYKLFNRNKNSVIGVTKIFKNPKNFFYGNRIFNNKIDIVASGGVSNSNEVTSLTELGAKSVQIWTSLIYEGPGLVKKLNKELACG